jgi:hypothetical protein
MNKKMISNLSLLMLGLLCANVYANTCSISSFTAQQLILLPQQHNSTNFAFSVACQKSYSVRFSSLNIQSSDGIGFLRNGPHKVKVKISVRNHQNLPWGLPIQQFEHHSHKYIVTAALLDSISPTTPAGQYKDQIKIQIEF